MHQLVVSFSFVWPLSSLENALIFSMKFLNFARKRNWSLQIRINSQNRSSLPTLDVQKWRLYVLLETTLTLHLSKKIDAFELCRLSHFPSKSLVLIQLQCLTSHYLQYIIWTLTIRWEPVSVRNANMHSHDADSYRKSHLVQILGLKRFAYWIPWKSLVLESQWAGIFVPSR